MPYLAPLQTQQNVSANMEASRLDSLKTRLQSGDEKTEEQLRSLSRQFESIFIHQMLKSMRKTVPKSQFFDSFSMDMYQSMMDEEIAKELSQQKGIGLADMLYRELVQIDKALKEAEEDPREAGLAAVSGLREDRQ